MYISKLIKFIISIILCLTVSIPFAVSSFAIGWEQAVGWLAEQAASNILWDAGKKAVSNTDMYKNTYNKFIDSAYENCPQFAKYIDGVSEKELIKLNEEGLAALKVPAEVALSVYDYWDATFDMSNLPKDSNLGYVDGAKYFSNGMMAYPYSKMSFKDSYYDTLNMYTSFSYDGHTINDSLFTTKYISDVGWVPMSSGGSSDQLNSVIFFDGEFIYRSSYWSSPHATSSNHDTRYCVVWDDIDKYDGGISVFFLVSRNSQYCDYGFINPFTGTVHVSRPKADSFVFPIALFAEASDELPLDFDYDRFNARRDNFRTAVNNSNPDDDYVYYYIYPDGKAPDITNPDDVVVPMSVINDVTKTPEPATPSPAPTTPSPSSTPTTIVPPVGTDVPVDSDGWGILDFLKWLFGFFSNLGNFLLGIFSIPDGYMDFKLYNINYLFINKFGIDIMDFGIVDTNIFSPFSFFKMILTLSPRRPDNITAELYGQTLTIINFDYVDEHIDTIHWVIRVLLYPFLLFFIYNNILMLLRGLKFTSGGIGNNEK